MQVERRAQAVFRRPVEECFGIRKVGRVPRVPGPPLGLSRLVFGGIVPPQLERVVPVHVDHEHVERHVERVELVDQVPELLVGVGPVARPPGAEREAGRHRHATGHLDEVGQCALVVVPVAEEIEVLALARRPRDDPAGPVKQGSPAVIHHGPACARQQAGLQGNRTLGTVQRACRSLEVSTV